MRRSSANTVATLLLAIAPLCAVSASAIDFRFDVATDNGSADNTDWFGSQQLPALNFPSVNGHDIEQGGTTHNAAITAAGNTLGIYYDYYHTLFATETSTAAAKTVENWDKTNFGSTASSRWLVLNEVDSATWSSSSGDAYRAWIIDTLKQLNAAGYKNIILFSPRGLASKTYQSTWQAISQYAYIGVETFLDGQTVKNDNFSLSTIQAYYQGYYNSWTSTTNGAGVDPSHIFADEHFSVNKYSPSNYWGANGISGTDWQAAIEIRDIAIHNIPFGGFIGYAWDKDAQATGNDAVDLAAQLSYERAYASTLTVQSEVPTWTGNDNNKKWADYLNWTGGLPSTASAPYPLLAATNPTLPKQTTANFFNTIKQNTTVTLDGNQSITHLGFDSSYSYTIAAGTGGSLTLTGSGATLSVNSGSHSISANLIMASNVAANIMGTLSSSGTWTNNGYAVTKSGSGTLTIAAQSNAANAAIAMNEGTLNFNADAGSSTTANLAFSASGGTTNFNSAQHLASFSLTGGNTIVHTTSQFVFTHGASVSTIATLDLAHNDLIIDYPTVSPIDNIRAALASGYNGGKWNGKGIISSSAAAQAHYTLGYGEASDILGLTGSATATIDRQTIDATTLLVRFTLNGDANLNSKVDTADFADFVQGFTGGDNGWTRGDFDYNGTVDLNDFAIFLDGYTASGSALNDLGLAIVDNPTLSDAQKNAMLTMAGIPVPEPGSLSLALLASPIFRRRRR